MPSDLPSASAPPTDSSASRPLPPRRVFRLGNMRFRVPHSWDVLCDGLNYVLEGFVYLIGPLLILLALGIISLLSYTFFTILVPMMQHKHSINRQPSSYGQLIVSLHITWVIFLLVNILWNYALCVMTRNVGPHYDKVVREFAEATQVEYPETPQEVAQYRRDFEDRMVLRMRRRQARAAEAAENVTGSSSSNGVTQRRGTSASSTLPITAPPPPPMRGWMLMAPMEWGFCANSNQPKPPRSHYDHVTKSLVLNLDHYCPWMFNAIGYFNYRYFVSFLMYIFVAMVYGSVVMLQPFMNLDTPEYKEQWRRQRHSIRPIPRMAPMLPYRNEKMLVTLSFMLCVALVFAIAILGGFHVYLTLTAQTTIEFHANWTQKHRAKQQGTKWKNPYDQGWRRNWQHVFGTRHWFLAMLPSRREPEFLPCPVPGHKGRRKEGQKEPEQMIEMKEGETASDNRNDENV